MPISEGQTIGLITTVIGAVVGLGGLLANRYGTFNSRKTELERNLGKQYEVLAQRFDASEKSRIDMENAFRLELENGAKERRNIEAEFRQRLQLMEERESSLLRENMALMHENWILKHQAIGSTEDMVHMDSVTSSMIQPFLQRRIISNQDTIGEDTKEVDQ